MVNLSFSFRTPSTSSPDILSLVKKRAQEKTLLGNENSEGRGNEMDREGRERMKRKRKRTGGTKWPRQTRRGRERERKEREDDGHFHLVWFLSIPFFFHLLLFPFDPFLSLSPTLPSSSSSPSLGFLRALRW